MEKKDVKNFIDDINIICDECGVLLNEQNTKIINEENTEMEFKGETFKVLKSYRVCEKCNTTIFDDELATANSKRLSEAYAMKYGFTMDDINVKTLREYYGLKQTTFSKLLGIGLTSIKRYESGRVMPNNSQATIFKKLTNNKESIKEFFEINKVNLTFEEIKEVEERIKELFNNKEKSEIIFRDILKEIENEKYFEEYLSIALEINDLIELSYKSINRTQKTGLSEFNFNKFISLIIHFTVDRKTSWNELNNFLWYADFLKYQKEKISLTGSAYIKNKNGIWPKHYNLILSILEQIRFINKEVEEFSDGFVKINFTSLKSFKEELFDERDKEIIKYIDKIIAEFGSIKIENLASKTALEIPEKEGDIIDYDHASTFQLIT
ncbi:putative zinc finger/helix-turn-helix YgiT family protein [Paenibacillus sp. SORGH_AS306]|uniref:type II TA system antitoxin MqsA family protein n=1 Tax=unclassified Paenibacillus TaxID=185978 RepID=UPI00278B733F|nr:MULTISPECIES: type II TA system antitoxin MqsA family protein [unclassified Paenibacillus]MDQ1235484.1 putative zinc finger/helix-turn-helix YgiT family protein [Paenibacillus sp. SORGH_AS_0306]MDR6112533.1 putative zinc finger/helix-turn-helix YgiT family protein [Paenibacillus sp. SORGH_AS_0338]